MALPQQNLKNGQTEVCLKKIKCGAVYSADRTLLHNCRAGMLFADSMQILINIKSFFGIIIAN